MIDLLLVDDDELVRESLGMLLRQEGFAVTAVAGGREALAAADAQAFDLVLVDVRMPGMNGLEVVARLRERLPQAHYVVVTAYADEEAAVEAVRLGVHDYLRKPFSMESFLERLRAVRREQLRRRLADPARALRRLVDALAGRLPGWGARVARVARAARVAGERLALDPGWLSALDLGARYHALASGEDGSPGEPADRVEQVAELVAFLAHRRAEGLPPETARAAAVLAAAVDLAERGETAVEEGIAREVRRALAEEPEEGAVAVPAERPPRLELVTLGAAEIRVDGRPVPREAWESARARWLLIYLVSQRGRRVSRERLAELFCPGGEPGRSRRSLLGTVHRARKALGLPQAILTEGRYYRFQAGLSYRWDLEELERAVQGAESLEPSQAVARLARVSTLYGGPFLEECPDDWAEELRRHALGLAVDGLSRLAELLLDRDPEAAEQRARHALALEPTAERASAALIRALALRGRRDEAVRAYHRCKEMLESLLDLPPGPEVTRAYLEIR